LIRQQLSNCSGLHFHEELTAMHTSEMGAEPQEVKPEWKWMQGGE
jgi:hypothetical protein